jgi:hypothetical protein
MVEAESYAVSITVTFGPYEVDVGRGGKGGGVEMKLEVHCPPLQYVSVKSPSEE